MMFIKPNQIQLCRAGSCCPILEKISDDQFTLSDDHEGMVQISKDELSILKEAIEHFEKNA